MPIVKSTPITTQEQLRVSYNRIFQVAPIRETEAHYHWIMRLLKPVTGRHLLDIACGMGFLLEKAQNAGLVVHGIDISDVAIPMARTRVPQADLRVGNAEALPYPDAYFDYVTNLGSLEHFLNPDQGVREMARVLRPNGVALLLVPNSYYLVFIWHVLKEGGVGQVTMQEVERLATRREWQNLIERNGLQVHRVYKYNPSHPTASLKYLLIRPFIPLNLSYCFVFICGRTM